MRLARAWMAIVLGAGIVSAQTMPAMAAGHPPIGGMMGAATAEGDAAPMVATGSISLQVKQGTAGGPKVAGDAVTIALMHGEKVRGKYELKLDEHGVAIVPAVPITAPVVPVVTIIHGGIVQQTEGPEMSPANPNAKLEAQVFETTPERPELVATMRHVIVGAADTPDAGGVQVTEMVEVSNPTDRVWVGRPEKCCDGTDSKVVHESATFSLVLPTGAEQIELAGALASESTKYVEGRLVTGTPLFPGATQFQCTYRLPVHEGMARLEMIAPLPTRQVRVFVPENGATVTAEGLAAGRTVNMGRGPIRTFAGEGLKAGGKATLAIAGWPTAAMAAETGGTNMTTLAVVGAGVAAFLGVGIFFFKRPKAAAAKS